MCNSICAHYTCGLSSEITNWICHPAHREMYGGVPLITQIRACTAVTQGTSEPGQEGVTSFLSPGLSFTFTTWTSHLHLNWTCIKMLNLCTAGYKQRGSETALERLKLLLPFPGARIRGQRSEVTHLYAPEVSAHFLRPRFT